MANALNRILVPVDFGAASRRALRFARALACKSGGSVTLAHVMPGRGLSAADDKWWRGYAAETLQGCADRARLPAGSTTIVLRGNPAEAIAKYADDEAVDLVVLSGRGKRAWDGSYLGAVSLGILKHARVPVLVLPARRATRKAAA
jgi:nucleotide-binding universal stress UspA family protein